MYGVAARSSILRKSPHCCALLKRSLRASIDVDEQLWAPLAVPSTWPSGRTGSHQVARVATRCHAEQRRTDDVGAAERGPAEVSVEQYGQTADAGAQYVQVDRD